MLIQFDHMQGRDEAYISPAATNRNKMGDIKRRVMDFLNIPPPANRNLDDEYCTGIHVVACLTILLNERLS